LTMSVAQKTELNVVHLRLAAVWEACCPLSFFWV